MAGFTRPLTLFAQLALERSGQLAHEFLSLHRRGNWGEITEKEKTHNEMVVKKSDRAGEHIMSAYSTSFWGEIIWIITRFDQNNNAKTFVFLPREYEIVFEK